MDRRTLATAAFTALTLLAASCTESGDGAETGTGSTAGTGAEETVTSVSPAIDFAALGLWDDGPCDEVAQPFVVGIQVTVASAVITAGDQAFALEAAAEAFNRRGGANGHCIQVEVCDEQADQNEAINCARTLDEAGVVVNINDTSASPGSDVGDVLEAAGIARFAIGAGTPDLTDPNSYPFDAGGIGSAMVMPQALIDQGVTRIANIRVDLPAASAIVGLFEDIYADQGAEFVADIPVPGGTTDYSQFILAAEDAGAEGVVVPLGGQEAIQLLRAGQQLGTELLFSTSLGTLPYEDLAELGDFAEQIVLNGSNPPATADDPVVRQLVADLAASGERVLQPQALKAAPMHSWIGLYALLAILRESGTDELSRANVAALIDASGPIDMLGLTADWTPNTDNPGAFPRTGNGYYSFWRWDPTATFDGDEGNLVSIGETNFVDLLCGSPLGGSEGTC